MGKKRIAVVGEEPAKKEKKVKPKAKPEKKADDKQQTEPKATSTAEEPAKKEKKSKKRTEPKKTTNRGSLYLKARAKVDRNKSYPLDEALKLLKEVSISSFIGSVDVHLIVSETGLNGEIKFPHPAGKEQIIRIADDELLAQLEKGKIDFSALVAHPSMMPKLAKYAKLLGPRGLMPNPKAGTISETPEKLVKQMTGKKRFKTEAKFPLIHITIGKTDSKEANLKDNFQALVEAIGKAKILKAVIAPTMGPGIKIDLTKLS